MDREKEAGYKELFLSRGVLERGTVSNWLSVFASTEIFSKYVGCFPPEKGQLLLHWDGKFLVEIVLLENFLKVKFPWKNKFSFPGEKKIINLLAEREVLLETLNTSHSQ